MAVTPATVRSPVGLVEPAMFPAEDMVALDERLAAYIAEGESHATPIAAADENDDAVKAWTYWRAFTAVFIRLSASPASVTMNDQGGKQHLVTQIENFREMAAEQRARFDALILAAADVEEVVPLPIAPASGATRTVVGW